MNVYQDALGSWVLFDGESKHVFATQSEAVEMSEKLIFAARMQSEATSVAQAIANLDELVAVYFDRSYNTGESAIVDADVEALGLIAADIGSGITLAQQLKNLRDNAVVDQADYGATLSALRTDI